MYGLLDIITTKTTIKCNDEEIICSPNDIITLFNKSEFIRSYIKEYDTFNDIKLSCNKESFKLLIDILVIINYDKYKIISTFNENIFQCHKLDFSTLRIFLDVIYLTDYLIINIDANLHVILHYIIKKCDKICENIDILKIVPLLENYDLSNKYFNFLLENVSDRYMDNNYYYGEIISGSIDNLIISSLKQYELDSNIIKDERLIKIISHKAKNRYLNNLIKRNVLNQNTKEKFNI